MGNPRRSTEPRPNDHSAPALDQQETAGYIADMALELRRMAGRADLPFLTYLLEMVVLEGRKRRRKFRDEAP